MTDAWLPDLARAGVKYHAIAEALGSAIEKGQLRPGERLPPQRALAARLGVDLTTISKAYDAARQRGLIEARGRAGSYVREPQPTEPRAFVQADTGMNMPPELPGGLLARALAETSTALLLDGTPIRLQYQPAGGAPPDRAAAAALMRRIGLPSDEEQVLVSAGGQNALHAILGATMNAGDAVACGRHVYPGFKAIAERLGLRLVPLARFTGAALRAACDAHAVKALYVVPTNDNPTTRTLSAAERREIATVAEERGFQVIEDDAYGALAADALPPIASLIPHRAWYVASTSKIISPALRVAFVRAPSIAAALRLAADIHETTIMAPPLNVAVVTSWIADGTHDRLLSCMRAEAERRQRLAREVLGEIGFEAHPQGYHLWMPLGDGIRAAHLAELMRATQLSVVPAERFAVGADEDQAVRISLGGPIGIDQLTRGLRILHGYAGAPTLRAAALI